MMKSRSIIALLSLSFVVGGCGLFSRDGNKVAAPEPVVSAIGVNAWLWQAAIDTLHFMPMRSLEPASGVIVTDWYVAPDNVDERVQVVVRFTSESLRSDGVKVSVIRQTRSGGDWLTADVQAATEMEIEEAILTRARQLRVDTLG